LSFRPALEKLLARLLRKPTDIFPMSRERQLDIDTMMRQWMFEEPEKKNVLSFLESFRLDESAIEAQAIRHCLSELEVLDRILTSLESRRNKALGFVTAYRESLARRLRESSDRPLQKKPVLQLTSLSNKSVA
jgi:hypothetical protein